MEDESLGLLALLSIAMIYVGTVSYTTIPTDIYVSEPIMKHQDADQLPPQTSAPLSALKIVGAPKCMV